MIVTYLLLILTIFLYLSVILKKTFYPKKVIFSFFLIPCSINCLIILIRIFSISTRNYSETTFFIIITSGFISFSYLCGVLYLKLFLKDTITSQTEKEKDNYKSITSTLTLSFPRRIFLFFSSVLTDLHQSYEIFVLSTFKTSFHNYMKFVNKYFLLLPFENIFLLIFILTSNLLFILIHLKLSVNNLFLPLFVLFVFNLIFRITIAIFYWFLFLNNFRFTLLGKDYFENFDNYFYSWEFLKGFKSNFSFAEKNLFAGFLLIFFNIWKDFKRISLFLRSLNDFKTKIDSFISFLFVFFLIKVFVVNIFFNFCLDLLILLLHFSLILQSCLFFFFKNSKYKQFLSFLNEFDFWLKTNQIGFLVFQSPADPFFVAFSKLFPGFKLFFVFKRDIQCLFFNFLLKFRFCFRKNFSLFILAGLALLNFILFINLEIYLFFLINFAYFAYFRFCLYLIYFVSYYLLFYEPLFFTFYFFC